MTTSFRRSFPQLSLLPVPTVRLGLISRIFSGATPDKTKHEYWENGTIPWVASGEVNQSIVTKPTDYITSKAVLESSTKLMPAGSLIIALAGQGKTKAMVAQMGIAAYGNQSLACIADFAGEPRFLYWWLRSLYREIRGLSSQDTRDGLNQAIIGQLPIPIFDTSTQRTIADFLDRETTCIDQLIEKKERLVSLLDEKRQAALSLNVTGLLSDRRELIETSSRFLPVVPRHWQVSKLKFGILGIEQGWSPECEGRLTEEGEWGVLKVGCVNYGHFRDTEHKALPNNLNPRPSLEIRPGDLLMSRANTPELVGSVALVERTRPSLMLCDKLYRILVNKKRIDSEFLYYVLNDRYVRRQIESECTGASQSMQNLSQAFVREIEIAYPPLHEQTQIAIECRNISQLVSALIANVQRSIELLRELRSALITAAVTGQIDVMTWSRRGETDRRLEAIAHDLEAEREEAAV